MEYQDALLVVKNNRYIKSLHPGSYEGLARINQVNGNIDLFVSAQNFGGWKRASPTHMYGWRISAGASSNRGIAVILTGAGCKYNILGDNIT